MDRDELLRNCSPEFQEHVKKERAQMAKEEAAQLERDRAATPDAFLQEIKGMRADIQALPDKVVSALRRQVIEAAVYIGTIVLLADLARWLYRTFVK